MAPGTFTIERSKMRFKKYLTIGGMLFGAVVMLVGAFALLSHVDKLELQTVSVSGTKVADEKAIENAVWDELSGKYLYLFSKKNAFIFPKRNIIERVLSEFPRLTAAKVDFANYQAIRVEITERDPAAVWCDAPETAEGQLCYFLDQDGMVFDSAPRFSTGLYTRFFGPIEGAGDSVLRKYFFKETFPELRSFLAEIEALGLSVETVSIDKHADASVRLETGTSLLFQIPDSYEAILDDLRIILSSIEKNSISLETVDYIDVRFSGKAFYKIK